jgi:tetratricopeptide (TPR) repeat protein
MLTNTLRTAFACLLAGLLLFQQGCAAPQDVVRPEKIVSKRKVIHEQETYTELAGLWKKYNDAFPSEDAYANWMYAARYAGDENYVKLLEKGLKKYPSNPTLLYLTGILNLGKTNDDAIRKLERAAELDPAYDDAWYALASVYQERNDDEKMNLALKRLLELGAVSEEIMDFNYNTLSSLDSNAILVTNGDMDTYPCWILQRILNYRTDVVIMNISLMNTDWYPGYLMDRGLPRFITQAELMDYRTRRLEQVKQSGTQPMGPGPFGDSLVVYMIDSAKLAGRPVYFALTLADTEILKPLKEAGELIGLAIRVTPPDKPYASELAATMTQWLKEYRTGGLDSWKLKYANSASAGRWIVSNYAFAMVNVLDTLKQAAPDMRGELFGWYRTHLDGTLPSQFCEGLEKMWCQHADVPVIGEWCRKAGLKQ